MANLAKPDDEFDETFHDLITFNPVTHVLNAKLEVVDKLTTLVQRVRIFLKKNYPAIFGKITVIDLSAYDPIAVLGSMKNFIESHDDALKRQDIDLIEKLQEGLNNFVKQTAPQAERARRFSEFLKAEFAIRDKIGLILIETLSRELDGLNTNMARCQAMIMDRAESKIIPLNMARQEPFSLKLKLKQIDRQ